jgi:hypothetical protein
MTAKNGAANEPDPFLIKQPSERAAGIQSGLSSSKCLPLFSVGFAVQSPLYGLRKVWREVKELQSERY